MLPRWALGYQQSHRTLASREEVLQEAKTFREKKLPCDALIYLGTGFCPSGWNTANGSFAWNARVFPDPKQIIQQLHDDHFNVVLHSVILTDRLSGSVTDTCEVSRFDEQQVGCYWDAHRADFALGVDGWWPDEGDPLDVASHVARHRMYWEGPQMDRPNVRPFSLHRNGFAGMQRYASILWSGDVDSRWETLKTQVPSPLTRPSPVSPTGAQTLAASSPPANSLPNFICAGSSSELSAPLPQPWPHLEIALAVGLEHRRSRPSRNPQLSGRRHARRFAIAQSASRNHLPQISGTPLSHAALSL